MLGTGAIGEELVEKASWEGGTWAGPDAEARGELGGQPAVDGAGGDDDDFGVGGGWRVELDDGGEGVDEGFEAVATVNVHGRSIEEVD